MQDELLQESSDGGLGWQRVFRGDKVGYIPRGISHKLVHGVLFCHKGGQSVIVTKVAMGCADVPVSY